MRKKKSWMRRPRKTPRVLVSIRGLGWVKKQPRLDMGPLNLT